MFYIVEMQLSSSPTADITRIFVYVTQTVLESKDLAIV